MSILHEARGSDSQYVEMIMHGHTTSDGSLVRPAECHWHMVFTRLHDRVQFLVVGPWTTAGVVSYSAGAEILWIKFKLGAFMPHLPTPNFLDAETPLPGAARRSFWLHGSAWQCPDYGNADTFVDKLVRDDVLVCDPVVDAVLHDRPYAMSPRTVRNHFIRATGLTQGDVRQIARAQRAAALLRQGASILDTVHEAEYFDQPHLTRSLKRWIGHTPAQIARSKTPA